MEDKLDSLYRDLLEQQDKEQARLPPVARWSPPLSGDIDIRIAADGVWYHEGAVITRAPLVKLFSSILKREQDDYFLVTPVEKWRIQVDDAPFFVTAMEVARRDGQQALFFSTSTDDRVLADAEHPLRIDLNPQTGEPRPYIMVRDAMEGLISRPVYYRMAELLEESRQHGKTVLGLSSMSCFFPVIRAFPVT